MKWSRGPPFSAERVACRLVQWQLGLCAGSCDERSPCVTSSVQLACHLHFADAGVYLQQHRTALGQVTYLAQGLPVRMGRGGLETCPPLGSQEPCHTGLGTCLPLLPASHTLFKGTKGPASLFPPLRPEVQGPDFAKDDVNFQDLMVTHGDRWEGGTDWGLGIGRCTLRYME